jgi:hypothetical protein
MVQPLLPSSPEERRILKVTPLFDKIVGRKDDTWRRTTLRNGQFSACCDTKIRWSI